MEGREKLRKSPCYWLTGRENAVCCPINPSRVALTSSARNPILVDFRGVEGPMLQPVRQALEKRAAEGKPTSSLAETTMVVVGIVSLLAVAVLVIFGK